MNTRILNAEHQDEGQETDATLSLEESIRRRQILGGFQQRMKELNSADIIMIFTDQTVLFEARNRRALELLYQCCGLNAQEAREGERVRVHPCEAGKIIAALKDVGLKVAA